MPVKKITDTEKFLTGNYLEVGKALRTIPKNCFRITLVIISARMVYHTLHLTKIGSEAESLRRFMPLCNKATERAGSSSAHGDASLSLWSHLSQSELSRP